MRRILAALAFAVGLASAALAADSSVPNLTAGGAVSATDLFYCLQSAGTTDRKCTAAQIATFMNSPLLNNWAATASPAVGNDNTQGYAIGSYWLNVNTGDLFIARAVGTGAAAWRPVVPTRTPGYIAANWYLPQGPLLEATGSAPTATTIIYCSPGFIDQRVTLSQLATRSSTNGSSNIQMAVYNNNPTLQRPGTLVGATGNIANNGGAGVLSGVFSGSATFQVEPGFYWFCLAANDTTGVYTGYGATNPYGNQILGSTTVGNVLSTTANLTGISSTGQTFGTWPDLTSATFVEQAASTLRSYVIAFLVASVP